MGLKPSPFGGAGSGEKNFPKKFFRADNFGVQPVFFRVFAYRRGRRTGDVSLEKGQKSPRMGAPPPSVFEVRFVSIRIGPFGGGKINFGAKVRKRAPPLRVFLRSVSLVKGAVSFRRRRGRGDRFRPGSGFGGPPPAGPSAFGVGSAAFSCSEEAPARGLFHSRGLSGCDALERRSGYEKFGLAGPAKAAPILKKKDRYVTAKTSCR